MYIPSKEINPLCAATHRNRHERHWFGNGTCRSPLHSFQIQNLYDIQVRSIVLGYSTNHKQVVVVSNSTQRTSPSWHRWKLVAPFSRFFVKVGQRTAHCVCNNSHSTYHCTKRLIFSNGTYATIHSRWQEYPLHPGANSMLSIKNTSYIITV